MVRIMYDSILTDFFRFDDEVDDSPRIQRAIDATTNGILYIPKGDYKIASPLLIKNRCSLDMHPAARLIAVDEMEFVLTYDGNGNFHELTLYDDGMIYDNLGLFIRGGDIDGNGKASCLLLANAHHYTLSNITLHNGKQYGLCVGGNLGGRLYELVANNVYCKCTMSGLKGNIGIYTNEHDGHYTDCFVVDYTTGFKADGSANRLTRCHIWGGTIPPCGKSMKEWSEFYGNNKKLLIAKQYSDEVDVTILKYPTLLWFFLCLSRQSFLSEGELHEARQASPCGDMRGFFFRIGLFRQSDLPLSIPDVSFYTRNPFAPRALPRFPATMDSSDSSFRFRSSEVSQVPDRTIATRPPTVSRLLSPSHADWTVCEGFTLGDGWPAEMYPNETLPPIHLR